MKPIKTPPILKNIDKTDIKEKLVFVGFTLGIFLPARLLFSSFVSDFWLGNLGLVTLIATVVLILINKNKLGRIGDIFQRQLFKSLGGKHGKLVLPLIVVFLVYFGASIVMIERGNTIYEEDKELFYALILENDGDVPNASQMEKLNWPPRIAQQENHIIKTVQSIDYSFSITYALMDDVLDGWVSHLNIVLFVEQFEILGLLIYYRQTHPHVFQKNMIR